MSSFLKIQMNLDSREAISRRAGEGQETIRRALYVIARFSQFGAKRALVFEKRTLLSLMQEIQKMSQADYANLPIGFRYAPRISESEEVLVDLSTVKDIFVMLIEDSIRHHPDNNPHIQIDFGSSQSGKLKAVIVYRDDGSGIRDDLKEKVFEPFFSTSQDGTGIGLTDIQSSVVAHGGTICENGEYGKGVRFEIALPLIEKGV